MNKNYILLFIGLALCVGLTVAGWYILSNSIGHLFNKIDRIEQQTKKLESLQRERASLQAKIKRLSYQSTSPGIHTGHLKLLIRTTLSYLGVAEKDHADWTRLLILTVVAESDKGRLLRQVKGPAKGIFQCERETEKDVLAWLKIKHPSQYQLLKDIRVPANIGIHEAEYNLAYSTALCFFVYKWRNVNPTGKSKVELAQLYKKYYNTPLGKATVKGVLAKLDDYKIKI